MPEQGAATLAVLRSATKCDNDDEDAISFSVFKVFLTLLVFDIAAREKEER